MKRYEATAASFTPDSVTESCDPIVNHDIRAQLSHVQPGEIGHRARSKPNDVVVGKVARMKVVDHVLAEPTADRWRNFSRSDS